MYGSHARVMLDYFLAEGIVCNHSTLIASLDVNLSNIVSISIYCVITQQIIDCF